MNTVILVVTICLIISFFIACSIQADAGEFGFILFFGLAIGCFLGLLIGKAFPNETKFQKTKVVYIENMQDGIGTKGRFYLGSGTIDGQPKYTYYCKNPNDSTFELQQIRCEKAKIKFIDTTNSADTSKASIKKRLPRIEKFEETIIKKNKWSTKNAIDFYYIIYVPQGSIRQEYNLDAK